MATVTVVRYKRRKRLGDDKSPMMYLLKPKAGESKIYSIDSLAQEIESIGSLSVEDVSHVMKSFVRAMKKVLVAGNKVKVDGLGIFYTTLTCPGVEQEKDCTVKNITRINLRFKVDNSLRLANDSTASRTDCKECKPVYEKYQKIFFKKTKEKFKQEHSEVARYEKAAAHLAKHPDDKDSTQKELQEETAGIKDRFFFRKY